MSNLQKLNYCTALDSDHLLSKCCGSKRWIKKMTGSRPFSSMEELISQSEKIWYSLEEDDWLESFLHHPKIGDLKSLKEKYSGAKFLADNEQSEVREASEETMKELAKYNEEYERKFGYIFIVCATGKSADQMLSIIKNRINNNSKTEIKIAMEEQNKITKLRLEKLV